MQINLLNWIFFNKQKEHYHKDSVLFAIDICYVTSG